MIDKTDVARTRRAFLKTGAVIAGAMIVPDVVQAAVSAVGPGALSTPGLPSAAAPLPMPARAVTSPRVVRPELLGRAVAALDRHADRLTKRDRVMIADFTAPSSQPRLHLVDLAGGQTTSFLVAHGSGSDPTHTGWLHRFSNDPGSNASCEGAFLADDYYVGKHGRSQRLIGLDATNDNALARAIVVHAAWYSNPDMLRTHGMLGRSQGCFAVGEEDLQPVFDRLGQGRMIYAAKI